MRATWLTSWLETELLGELLGDLRRGAELPESQVFQEAVAALADLRITHLESLAGRP